MFRVKVKIKNVIQKWISPFYAIQQEFKKVNPIFDTRYLDKKIEKHAIAIAKHPLSVVPINEFNVAFLATWIQDTGGHNQLMKNLALSFPINYKCKLFLTDKTKSEKILAANSIAEFKKHMEIDGVDFNRKKIKINDAQLLNDLLGQILEFSPKILISFFHPHDCLAAGLLALLKKYTQTKIVFCNMAMQYSTLGMSFAHLIWEYDSITAFITQKYRRIRNTRIIPYPYFLKDNFVMFNEHEIAITKSELGVPSDAFCTMSAGQSYKFFENGKSTYFEMIKCLLERNDKLWHVIITWGLTDKQKNILEKINIPDRLIVSDYKVNYKLYLKCADVFISSYPYGGGMMTLDIMSLKVPIVFLENFDNLLFRNCRAMPPNYEYVFDVVPDMLNGIEILLINKEERERIANANYEFLLENFDGNRIVQNILEAVDTNTFDPVISEADVEYEKFKDVRLLPF